MAEHQSTTTPRKSKGIPRKNLAGQTFGRLAAISYDGEAKKWNCVCVCGKTTKVVCEKLLKGNTKSCGCLRSELMSAKAAARNYKHGMARTREWETWHGIRERCENKNAESYKNYGARGIRVCERWATFEAFFEDMGPRPSSRHSIDRFPDQNGNYEPSNCRWATAKQQCRNKRNNVLLEYRGETRCLTEWAEIVGLGVTCIWMRLKAGVPVYEALSRPSRKKCSVTAR